MKIPLNQFEQYIDETILKRGFSYFKNGFVQEPEEITRGRYEAIVTGSESYTVELKINDGTIIEYACTCPYDVGPVCKHIAAVVFYIQQNELEIRPNLVPVYSKQKTTVKKQKKKTVAEQVNEILGKITYEDLKQFIREKTVQDPLFRNLFLSSFAHQNTSESKTLYAKQVKSILHAAAGREGFIYWNGAGSVGRQVNELLTIAQKQSENKNFKSAIFICTAVMEEMTEALQFADDSSGDIGGSIDFAFELLMGIAREKLSEEARKLLFEYCLMAFDKGIYSGWDWHLGIMSIASEIFNGEDEAHRLIACLGKSPQSEYEREGVQYIKLRIIKRTKGEKEAEKFIEQNLSNPKLRREAIQRALSDKAYEKATAILKDGIKQDEKRKPGLAKEWYDWLLKIAQAQNDKEKIVEYSRYLFMDNFHNEQDYYQLMKSNIQEAQWTAFIEGVIQDISTKKKWPDIDLIAGIYIREKWWGRLMQLVAQNHSLHKIEKYEKYLAGGFAEEIVDLYEKDILEYLKLNTGRGHYKTVCKYLRRMKKLGAGNKVNNMIEFFKKEYAQRRALVEELKMV